MTTSVGLRQNDEQEQATTKCGDSSLRSELQFLMSCSRMTILNAELR
jgi:hypothetical protein